MKKDALIGYSGFVGSTLLRQRDFSELYRSTNISEIEGREFDLVIAAAAPAQKWVANSNPFNDQKAVDKLISSLQQVKAKKFVLVSTVDVFSLPIDVDERSSINSFTLNPYGYNRRRLEVFVQQTFKDPLIVRLPGLVGTGLKKNIIYDLVHNNQVEKIDTRNIFQFYPMSNLWRDIEISLKHRLETVHLSAEPISVSEIAKEAFGITFEQELAGPLVKYDFKTIFNSFWGKEIPYQYNRFETIEAVKDYIQTESTCDH